MDQEAYRQAILSAIDGEIKARQFYQEISRQVKDAYLKELFASFAKEEDSHREILTQVLHEKKISPAHFDFQKDFKVAETIEMPQVDPDMNLKDAVGIAMKNEEIAMKKYMALAENCRDEGVKTVFNNLAAMEREHKFKMEKSFVDVAYPEAW